MPASLVSNGPCGGRSRLIAPRALAATLALVAACRADQANPPRPAIDAAPPAVVVELRVDGERVGAVSAAELATPRSLAELLPPGARDGARWQRLRADDGGPRRIDLGDFAGRMPDARGFLSSKAGQIRLEILPAAPSPGLPAEIAAMAARPIAALDGVTVIEIERVTAAGGPRAPAIVRAELAIVVDGGAPTTLTAEALAALPRTRGRKRDSGGVALADLVGSVVAPGRHAARVAVTTARGETAEIAGADLGGRDLLLVRHNRKGVLRFQRYPPESRTPSVDLRDVARLEISTTR